MKRIAVAVSVSIVLSLANGAQAQLRDRLANPAIPVKLTHPATLGIQAKSIAFGGATGPCADQLVDMLTEDFVQNNIQVIDREHLNTLLAEHNFSITGYVDQKTTAELGKILGPAALVFVKVQRCTSEKKSLYENRDTYDRNLPPVIRVNISRTQFFFRGSIQTVDLATGRIFAATTIENAPSVQNESDNGVPEFPSEFEVQDTSLHQAALSVHRLFFSWNENKSLVFFDDDDCNLKQAYQAVKKGAVEDALHLSVQNLEKCRSLPKADARTLSHAYYNLGMSHYVAGEYEDALNYLGEASKLRPGDIVKEATALCILASESAAQTRRIENQMAVEAAVATDRSQQRQASAAAKQPKTLSIKEIIAMRQAGLSEELTAAAIRKNNEPYNLSVEEMLELKTNGISEDLIKLMLEPTLSPARQEPRGRP